MRKKQRVAIAIVAVVAVAAVTSIVLRHGRDATTPNQSRAQVVSGQVSDASIVRAVQNANVHIDDFSATSVGGVVLLKGTANASSARQAVAIVHQLGFARVANLIVMQTPIDDEEMRRSAERQLASTRALDGCMLRVSCAKGVLRVEGTSSSDLQADVARNVLRHLGAQEVQVSLRRL